MKKRKVPCLLLALFLALSLIPAQAFAAEDFTDVAPSAWYYADVIKARDMGLISGYDDGSFRPENNIRYSEVIKLAACMNEKYSTGKITLPAGEGNPWYKVYVDYAIDKGIISKDYSWTGTATRADVAEIFVNGLPSSALADKNSVAEGYIPDVAMSHPQAAQIYRLYRAGILDGKGADHSFKPDDKIKRSEISAILTRMMDESARVEVTLGPAPEPEVPGTAAEKSPSDLELIYQTTGGELNYIVRSLPLTVVPYRGKAPYSYQWSVGGKPIEGTQEQILTVDISGNYACTVTDAAGASVSSDVMTVTFDATPPLAIAKHPADAVIVQGVPGQDMTLNVEVTGGHQPYSYQWYAIAHAYHDDYLTGEIGAYKCRMDDDPFPLSFEDTPDYASPTLDLGKLTLQDEDGTSHHQFHHYHPGVMYEGAPDTDLTADWTSPYGATFFCVVTDSYGQSVQSDEAELIAVYRNTVTGPEEMNLRYRRYDDYIAGGSDDVEEWVRWRVCCRGESYSVFFYKDGVEIPGTRNENLDPSKDASQRYLDISSLGPGTYHAEVRFEASPSYGGIEEETIKGDEFRYFIGEQPEEAVIPTGGSATLSFTTVPPGKAPFTYQWEKADTEFTRVLVDAKRAQNSPDILWIHEDRIDHGKFSDVEGATDAALTTGLPGTYRCRVTDADGYVCCTTPVFVYEQLRVTEQPVWTANAAQEVGCRFAGGLGENVVHLQKYVGTWVEEVIMGGAMEYDSLGNHVAKPEVVIPGRVKGSNDIVRVGTIKTQCGSGIFRFAIFDEFTGQWAYSESFTIPDD